MQMQEAHRHQKLNGQKSQGLQTRLSRCFFLTSDQDRWKFQLSIIVRISGSSVSLRKNSMVQHNGYMPRQWVFGLIPHFEDEIEGAEHCGCCIRNAHCDSESHRQEMGQVENNDRYLRQMGDLQTKSDELTDAREQLRVASPAERDDPDERSQHGVPRQQDLTQQQPPTESPPQKQHVPPQSLVATIETAITQGSTINNSFTQNQDHRWNTTHQDRQPVHERQESRRN